MSEVNDTIGLNPESPLKDSIKLIIRAGIEELVFISNDERGIGDPEIVHDVRVSARKLQTILESIGEILPLRLLNKGKARLKEIIKSLGKARENDVSIKLINHFLKQYGERSGEKSGQNTLKLLIARFKKSAIAHRKNATDNSKVFNDINYLRNTYLKDVINLNIKQYRDIKYLNANQSLRSNGLLILPKFFDRVMALGKAALLDPVGNNSEELHKMRIKAKPLRYTMEFFRFAYGDRFKKLVREMKYFVELLGDIHDRDVALEQLSEFYEEIAIFNKIADKKMNIQIVKKLMKKLEKERADHLKKVKSMFNTWVKNDYREKMIISLSQ